MSNKGTKEGIQEEISLVKIFNTKTSNSFWNIVEEDIKNSYAIHVNSLKYGKINQSKIWAKSDVFLAKGNIPSDYLVDREFYLSENDFDKFKLKYIPNSGISVKHKTSSQYQIMKMGSSTFKKVFGSNILAAGASIYCNNTKDFNKNTEVLEGWGIENVDFINFFEKEFNINIDSINSNESKDVLKKIKKYSNQQIHNIITANQKISDFIFKGVGNFDDPFYAVWIFEHGKLKTNKEIDFSVTTGSGRSKGIYTIVIKPRIKK